MHSGTVICEAIGTNGEPCGARAVVQEIHYRYESAPPWMLGVDRVLTEIHADIECPRCGYRTQREMISQPSGPGPIQIAAGSIATPNVGATS